jgi:predicted MFS family arabinose efflux permease
MTPLLASIVFNSFCHMVFSGMRLGVALDAINLGASAAAVGAISALFGLLPAMGSIAMGRYIDRNGSRLLLRVCPFLLAGSPLILVFWPNLFTLGLAGLLTGGSFLTLHLVNQQVVGKLSTAQDRPANFAIQATWIAASQATSPALTGFLIDHVGFRWAFACLSAISVLAFLYFVRKLPILEGKPPSAKAAVTGSVFELVREARLRRIYIVSVMFATSWDIFLFMTPLYGASLNLSASQIGLIIACFSSATFAVRLFARAASRRFTAWQVLLLSLALNGVANFAFGLSGIMALLLPFAFIMGLGHGLANPMLNTLLYEASPPTRVAEVLGLRTSVSMTLQVGMPVLAGALGTLIGVAPLFWLVAAMQLGGSYSTRGNWHAGKKGAAAPPDKAGD